MNPVEAKRAGLSSIPTDEPAPALVNPVSIDFDATGGIEQLNRVISDLHAPYHVRVKALQIQHEVNQLANTVDKLNAGKDA